MTLKKEKKSSHLGNQLSAAFNCVTQDEEEQH